MLVGLIIGLMAGAAAAWGIPWARRQFRLRVADARGAVVLGGRRYHAIEEGTVEWHGWFIRMLGEVGLMPLPDIGVAEDGGAYVQRIAQQLYESGKSSAVLAGMLLPEGVSASSWRPETAAEVAAQLQPLTDAQDHAQIYALTMKFLIDFFVGGTASSVLSIASSKTPMEGRPAAAPPGRATVTASGLAWSSR